MSSINDPRTTHALLCASSPSTFMQQYQTRPPETVEDELRYKFAKAQAKDIPVLDFKFLAHCVVAGHVIGPERAYFGCLVDL